jgi:hypothetical protein
VEGTQTRISIGNAQLDDETLTSGLQCVRNSDFMHLLAKKLAVFISLKPEEQAIVSGLVSVCVRVLCAVCVLYHDTDTQSSTNALHGAIGSYYLTNSLGSSSNPHLNKPQGATGGSEHGGVDHSVHSYVNLNTPGATTLSPSSVDHTLFTQQFVEHAIGFNHPLTVSNSHSHGQAAAVTIPVFDPLDPLFDILQAVEKLWLVDMREHTTKIADFGVKFCACRHLLHASSTQTNPHTVISPNRQGLAPHGGVPAGGQKRAADPVLRKLIEKENPQIRRILESSVMVREMLAEVRGAIYACKQLRTALNGLTYDSAQLLGGDSSKQSGSMFSTPNANKRGGGSTDDDMNDSWGEGISSSSSGTRKQPTNPALFEYNDLGLFEEEEDIWERAEELEAKRRAQQQAGHDEVGFGVGVEINEEDFLHDCSELENGLDQLLQ